MALRGLLKFSQTLCGYEDSIPSTQKKSFFNFSYTYPLSGVTTSYFFPLGAGWGMQKLAVFMEP